MLDVAITPLLWRLDYYGIQMPKQAAPLMKYAERLFAVRRFRGTDLRRARDAQVIDHRNRRNCDVHASSSAKVPR